VLQLALEPWAAGHDGGELKGAKEPAREGAGEPKPVGVAAKRG